MLIITVIIIVAIIIIIMIMPRSGNPSEWRRHRLPEVQLLAGSSAYASRAECVLGV